MKLDTKKLVIKTITCHDVYNFGASLQAYALMKYLQKYGHDVKIIDYKPDYLSYNLWSIGPKWRKNIFMKFLYFSFVVPRRLLLFKRRKRFDTFTKTKLQLTDKTYTSFDELKKDPPNADIYFAGSDQIWNTGTPNGKDPSFYLDFAPKGCIKASYAASFSVSEIAPEYKEFVKNQIIKLDYISVREDTGLKILKNLEIKKGTVVIDPVYLLGKNDWASLANFKAKEKYIFIYDQENNSLIKSTAKRLAKKYDLKIYALESLYPMSYADKKIRDAGPEEFLGLIQNCEICLTNSFHCIGFSLIFNKKFYLFKRTHQKVNSRMLDLLSYLDLSDRVADDHPDKINNKAINFKRVDELIEKRRADSVKYIDKVLDGAEKNV
jgi:hypothetical protein